MKRKIIRIDEEKCDGCGQCARACAEGAIEIVDGKARLVSDEYCDGLGACIGECPRGALTVEEREARDFDARAVEKHLARLKRTPEHGQEHVCPGRVAQSLQPAAAPSLENGRAQEARSALRNWPVQLRLAPVSWPHYQGARLLIAADCVAFSMPDFHGRLLDGRTLLIGCPKLDDADQHLEKLAEILKRNDIRSVEVAYMEVPCCFGLLHLVRVAIRNSGKDIPVTAIKVGIGGGVLDESPAPAPAARRDE